MIIKIFKSPLKKRAKLLLILLLIFAAGFLLPQRIVIPVRGATIKDWNQRSFWYEPWGTSGVHKGIDIFGKLGTEILSTTDGIVVYTGQIPKGGNVVIVLGPKWRLHYFAHLGAIKTTALSMVASGSQIGTLGDSGNAQGKPPHLHYSIVSLAPLVWKMDNSTQGYKKALYIDPGLILAN